MLRTPHVVFLSGFPAILLWAREAMCFLFTMNIHPAGVVSGDMLESFFNLLQSGQVTTAKKVVSEDLDISWATKDEEVEELMTRSCHLAIKNFCPVTSWCRYKKVNFGP